MSSSSSSSISLLLFLFVFVSFVSGAVHSQSSHPKGVLINCGATTESTFDRQQWLPDTDYISTGISKVLTIPDILPILSTVRSFPLANKNYTPMKFCYVVPVFRNAKYLIRSTYYYGGVNSNKDFPPVFDQIVDGTIWSVVNTTEDYARGYSSYYEGVFVARGRSMSMCVAANTYTDSDPFISALEFVILEDSLYNSTDFGKYGLSLVARNSFGYGGPIIKFPDDPFDRYWEPFGDGNPIMQNIRNISASGFWNLPPSKIFDTELTTDQTKPMELQWPPVYLPKSNYYIALYFADNRGIATKRSRVFDISVNGIKYYHNLDITPTGVAVFATRWPLSGLTKITLTPAVGSDIGPLINAGEIFNVLLLGGKTVTRDGLVTDDPCFSSREVLAYFLEMSSAFIVWLDGSQVIALERVRNSLQNPPVDWNGDPCIPRQYSWTGVTCSEGTRTRVVALNLSSMGVSGSISPSIAKLTALTDIWLGNNNLSGSIPDLGSLKRLQTLHLENNQLNGEIPLSLGAIGSLRELFIQNNYLTGQVPNSLKQKPGLNLKISPGNRFSFKPPS